MSFEWILIQELPFKRKAVLWNYALKIKFLDKYGVGRVPNSLKRAKARQIQGNEGFNEILIPWSKNQMMQNDYTYATGVICLALA